MKNATKELFEALASYSENHPDLRFSQILSNIFGIGSDKFHMTDTEFRMMYNKYVFLNDIVEDEPVYDSLEQWKRKGGQRLVHAELCYAESMDVNDQIVELFFTTQDLKDQWGDDWDDAPYEHNAGYPYTPFRPDLTVEKRVKDFPDCWHDNGDPKWVVYRVLVKFDHGVMFPNYGYTNCPFSVEDINNGDVPWIDGSGCVVYAGTTYKDFFMGCNDKMKIIEKGEYGTG